MRFQSNNSLIIILLILLWGCCDNKELGHINFPQADRNANPYIGNESLYFVDNNNNTIIYKGSGRSLNTIRIDGCPDCCQDFYVVEFSDNTTFRSDFMDSYLHISLILNLDSLINKPPTNLTFSWSDQPLQGKIQNIIFNEFPINNMEDSARSWNLYHDTLTLRDKTFYNIFTSVVSINFSDRMHPDSIFYSISEGFVGIKFSDGNLFVKQ